jgi:hypothetical protein
MAVALWVTAAVACCALCAWGIADGGAPFEGARRSATEALSENPSGRCETDALI